MLKLGVLGSGSGTNMQAILDAIGEGNLDAEITCVIADVEGATILDRAQKRDIPAFFVDGAPFRTKLDGEAQARVIQILKEFKKTEMGITKKSKAILRHNPLLKK